MKRYRFWAELMLWSGLYLALILAPLGVAVMGQPPPGRGFWVEFGVGLGFVGLAMLGLQFLLTGRFRRIAAAFGTDSLLHFHRQAGLVAYWFILGHALVLLLADADNLAFLDPRVNAPRALALILVLLLVTLLVVLTLKRKRSGLSYEWWRLSHGIIAVLVVLIGLGHILMVGHYVQPLWKQATWVGLTVAAMALLVHVRVIKPLRLRRTPYELVDVRPEASRTWTIKLRPVGHAGVRFQAGQFAWLSFGNSPFSLQQHPFSFASSAARPETPAFTIKELGDFTGQVGQLQPGSRVFLEGPYGAFTLKEGVGDEVLFIAGGIGITPVMSILRTLHDRGDRRKLTLIHGAARLQGLAFFEEVKQMKSVLDLRVIHVLEQPPATWDGERGLVTSELLERVRPTEPGQAQYFVCGPDPMMDVVEHTLRRWGVPLRLIHVERFRIV